MTRIFICYRREDTSGYAGRLYDRLRTHFGAQDVFIDIDDIEPGADYAELIDRMIQSVDALIVLIGPQWLVARDRVGNPRLDDPGDFVRLEISAALDRGVRVIPVLVQGAAMPGAADLPPALVRLARRNAIEISDARWDYDSERLIRALESGVPRVQTIGGPTHGVAPHPPDTAGAQARQSPAIPGSKKHPAPLFGALPSAPAGMAVAGASAVLIWGVLIGRAWHPEFGGIRIGAGAIVVILVGLGLWWGQWRTVLTAGIAGLVGFAVWTLQLLAGGHPLGELLLPGEDGIANALAWLGALLVLLAGVLGTKKDATRR